MQGMTFGEIARTQPSASVLLDMYGYRNGVKHTIRSVYRGLPNGPYMVTAVAVGLSQRLAKPLPASDFTYFWKRPS